MKRKSKSPTKSTSKEFTLSPSLLMETLSYGRRTNVYSISNYLTLRNTSGK